jgi:hypothetical protein
VKVAGKHLRHSNFVLACPTVLRGDFASVVELSSDHRYEFDAVDVADAVEVLEAERAGAGERNNQAVSRRNRLIRPEESTRPSGLDAAAPARRSSIAAPGRHTPMS